MSPPNYHVFLTESANYFQSEFTELWEDIRDNKKLKQRLISNLNLLAQQISLFDVLLVITLAFILTIARYLATTKLFMPIAKWRGVPKDESDKIPESAWKLIFYLTSWTAITYYLFVHNTEYYFTNPTKVWQNYSIEKPIETYIYWIYTVELSFYIHSLYTTLLIDQRRKDTYTLMFHHILCVFMFVISYCNRSHKSGLLTLFLHDGCDVLLEATKLTRYFKVQHGVVYEKTEVFVNVGFVAFLLAWVSNRLYWFPLKQIYVASIHTKKVGLEIPFIFPLVLMLWAILIMNFYWFSFAIRLLFKVASGQIKELEDNREFAEATATINLDSETKEVRLTNANNGEVRKMSIDSGVEFLNNSEENEDNHSTSSKSSLEETNVDQSANVNYNLRQRKGAGYSHFYNYA